MVAFNFTDRDYKERKVVLEIAHEVGTFGIAIRNKGEDGESFDYMNAIIPLDKMRESGLFIKEIVRVKEVN